MADQQIVIEVVAKTDTGMIRDANEDNFIVTDDCRKTEWFLPKGEYLNSASGTLAAIADGMGGLNAGEIASKIVIDSIKAFLSQQELSTTGNNEKFLMTNAIIHAHEEIIMHSKQFPETEGMGSTAVVAWVKGTEVHIAWVGDSRCYILRNCVMMQLSKDHSYVQSLVEQGKITKEQAFHHPESNIITQSLGDVERKPKPDYIKFTLNNDDLLLLCSDGLNGMLQDDEITNILNENAAIAPTVDLLVEQANAAGGVDNISVIVLRIINGISKQSMLNGEILNNQKEGSGKKKTMILLIIIAVIALSLFFFNRNISSGRNNNQGIKESNTKNDSVITGVKDKNDTQQHHKDSASMVENKITETKEKIKARKDSVHKSAAKKSGDSLNDRMKQAIEKDTTILNLLNKGIEKKDAVKFPDNPPAKKDSSLQNFQ